MHLRDAAPPRGSISQMQILPQKSVHSYLAEMVYYSLAVTLI